MSLAAATAWKPFPLLPEADRGAVMDPYQRWASLTEYQGYCNIDQRAERQKVPVAIKLEGGDIGTLKDLVEIPPFYESKGLSYCTGYVALHQFDALRKREGVKCELGLPLGFLRTANETVLKPGTRRSLAGKGKAVIGVIDIGCAYLNDRFNSSSGKTKRRSTRLLSVWQQVHAADGNEGWSTPSGFGYGRELVRARINERIRETKGDPALETKQYKKDNYLQGRSGPEPGSHGTHVLATLAGQPDSLRNPASALRASVERGSAAPGADLIFVDVPRRPEGDTTGASLCVHIIDGLNYIVDRANGADLIVINISVGAQAGPHDGSSIVEQAIDDLVDRLEKDKRTLVVLMAAGNAFDDRRHCHAEGKIEEKKMAEFLWRLLPDDPTDNFLEIWYDAIDGSDIYVELIPPYGVSSGDVRCDHGTMLLRDGNPIGSVQHSANTVTGAGPMALLAVGPTRASERRKVASPHGLWTVRVHNHRELPLNGFHAWVERDDAPVGVPPRRNQSYLADANERKWTTGGGTLNNLATGKSTFAVAASDRVTGRVARYSSAGSQTGTATAAGRDRKSAVSILAPGDESPAAGGLLASGVLSGSTFRMSGTSVAAPVAARQLFELLRVKSFDERNKWLEQLRRAKAQPEPDHAPGPVIRPSNASPANTLKFSL